MKWWDDLWLNESFATFISFYAMSEIPELKYFSTVWATFLQYKYWGINTDIKSTTHPICAEIPSTQEAEALFDGISYGKGSAWLKQVLKVMDPASIKKAFIRYFATYKW